MKRLCLVIVCLFAASVSFASGPCEHLLSAKLPRHPWRWFYENVFAALPKSGPAYYDASFEVKIVSRPEGTNAFSPTRLAEQTVADFKMARARLHTLGFEMRSFVHILVAANPGVFAFLNNGEWRIDSIGPAYAIQGTRIPFGVPTAPGKWKRLPDLEGRGLKKASYLLLNALSDQDHIVGQREALVNELMRLTENLLSHQSRIWREARADFLTFQVLHKVDTPAGGLRLLSTALPDIYAYPLNSQILSSILYEISRRFGPDKVIHFIQWMDAQTSQLVPELRYARRARQRSDAWTKYISRESTLSAVANEIRAELNGLVRLFYSWAEQEFGATDVVQIRSLLLERGFTIDPS